MRIFLIFAAVLFVVTAGQAQQSAQYTQYIFNGLVINPAYAGSKGITNANVMYRSQWAGLEGAPTTQTLSIDGSAKSDRIGLGFHAINDQLGAQGTLGAYGSTAFRVRLTEKARLSLGFGAGILQQSVDWSKLNPGDPDPSLPTSRISTIVPDAKAGLFLNTERFYAGLSVANLIPFENDLMPTPARQYFFTSGYVMDLGEHLKFKPSFLIKENLEGPTNVDFNAFILIKEILWLGGSYRRGFNLLNKPVTDQPYFLQNAWAGIAELYLNQKFRVGYSYDVSLSALSGFASHEISLGYFFLKKQDSRMLSPRYF
jgi:type IX secretion system PorP/SprF family membrane protein